MVYFKPIKVDGNQKISIKQTVAPLHHVIDSNTYELEIQRDASKEKIELLSKSDENLYVNIDNLERTITVIIKNKPAELIMAINKIDANDSTLSLANVGFSISKYTDSSIADLRTYAYIKTDSTGSGFNNMSTYITNGTTLYTIDEVNVPEGYYKNGTIGLYITTDVNGNIKSASTVENSSLFDKGKCTINSYYDNYIELTIINNRKPEPTYSVVVENLNKYDDLTKIYGSVFNFKIDQQNGANINTNATTNSYGIATISDLNGTGNIKITIEQTSAGAYYKRDSVKKVIEINRTVVQKLSNTGNVYTKRIEFTNKTPSDVDVTINNETQQIIIKVLNERFFGLEIEKVDKEDKEILLPGAKFEIYENDDKLGEVITNLYGRGYIYMGDAPRNKTVRYTLKETIAPTGYIKVGDWYINVKFNEAGEIENVNLEGENISNESSSTGYMRLKITEPKVSSSSSNNKGGSGETYTKLEIFKEGINNPKLKLDKVVFDINVEAEDGRTLRAIKTTDKSGQIKLNGIPGNKIKIKLKELKTCAGYVLDDKERIITVEKFKTSTGDKIRLIEEETSKDLNIQIDDSSRTIRVTFKNEISENFWALALVKEDAEDELLTLKGAIYSIKDDETGDIYEMTTNSKGIAQILITPKKVAGLYTFKLLETKAPKGYILNNSEIYLEINVELDEAGNPYIKTSKIIKGEDVAEVQNQSKNYVEIHTKDQATEGSEPYDIKVVKVDIDDIDITFPDAVLQIDVQNSIGQTGLSKIDTTDSEGKIEIKNIKGAGTVEIDIEELVPPIGRKSDLKPKNAKFIKDENTGRLKLIDSTNVDTIINNKEHLITILVRNEPIDGNYTLVVQKNDYNNKNISLANVKMKILLPEEKNEREVITDKNGRIVLKDLRMPSVGTFKFKITEIEAPDGYKKLNDTIEVTTTFAKVLDVQEITDAKIAKDANAEVLEVKPNYLSIAVYNEQDEINKEDKYNLTLVKKDAEDETIPIENTKIKLGILYENGTGRSIETLTDESGRICINDLVTTGLATITVEEKEAPHGYDLDNSIKKIKCNITSANDIQIQEKNENLEVEIKNKEIEISMTNDRSKEYVNLHLEKFVSKINNENVNREPKIELENGKIKYVKQASNIEVGYGDFIEYTIRIYNEGTDSGYAKTIIENIPDGLEYVEDNELNKAYGWKKTEDNIYETQILSKETNESAIINGYSEENGLSYLDVKIVLKTIEKAEKTSISENIALIKEEENEAGQNILATGIYNMDNKAYEAIDIKYLNLQLNKKIKSISVMVDGKITKQAVVNDNLSKIEIPNKEINRAIVEVEYEITVSNVGTKAGKVNTIIDKIPERMNIVAEKSKGWTTDGKLEVNQVIGVGESITKTIVLKTNASNTGEKINIAEVKAEENIREKVISNPANVVISVKTGITPTNVGISIGILIILSTSTYFIKKKILK